jgi:hypothetical protein
MTVQCQPGLLDFTNAFAGNADFNHDGITNSQDYFDFNAFFTPADPFSLIERRRALRGEGHAVFFRAGDCWMHVCLGDTRGSPSSRPSASDRVLPTGRSRCASLFAAARRRTRVYSPPGDRAGHRHGVIRLT